MSLATLDFDKTKKKNVNTLMPKIELKKEFLLLPLHESRQTSPPPIEVEAGV